MPQQRPHPLQILQRWPWPQPRLRICKRAKKKRIKRSLKKAESTRSAKNGEHDKQQSSSRSLLMPTSKSHPRSHYGTTNEICTSDFSLENCVTICTLGYARGPMQVTYCCARTDRMRRVEGGNSLVIQWVCRPSRRPIFWPRRRKPMLRYGGGSQCSGRGGSG